MMKKAPLKNPNRKPTHPGEVLREDVLPGLGLSISAFAEAMGVSRQVPQGGGRESRTLTRDGRTPRQIARKRSPALGTDAGSR